METNEMDRGKRLVLALYMGFQLVLTGSALFLAVWVWQRYAAAARAPLPRVLLIISVVLVFNYAYILVLLLFRWIVPRPPQGFFPHRADGSPPGEARILMLNLLLVKARFHTPWSSMFTSVIVNLFPLNIVYRRLFGPDTPSATIGDTYICLDPYLLKAGRNVQFGFNCVIICHLFDHRGLLIRAVTIGDHAVVGGEATVMPGVTIGHHAVLGAKSLVPPGTVIGPYEFWAGTPARKIRDLEPGEDLPGKLEQPVSTQ